MTELERDLALEGGLLGRSPGQPTAPGRVKAHPSLLSFHLPPALPLAEPSGEPVDRQCRGTIPRVSLLVRRAGDRGRVGVGGLHVGPEGRAESYQPGGVSRPWCHV